MRNLLEMIYEYQLLRSKEEYLDIRLDDDERVRQMGLDRLLQGETIDRGSRRRFPRVKLTMPVQFTLQGGFESGDVRDISAGGLCIGCPRPPPVGASLIVRIADSRSGSEYVFPCRVVWRVATGNRRVGIAFDGVPSSSELHEDTGVWHRSLHFGLAQRSPLVA